MVFFHEWFLVLNFLLRNDISSYPFLFLDAFGQMLQFKEKSFLLKIENFIDFIGLLDSFLDVIHVEKLWWIILFILVDLDFLGNFIEKGLKLFS